MGLGLGAGLGMMMPSMLQQSMNGAARKKQVTCPKCHGTVDANARFCPMCGQQLVVVNRCLQCGVDLPVEAKFCMVCGAKVEKSGGVCPHCGKETLPGATYCNDCGEKVS
jgi:predicted amidophosphoribosyltransferase